MRISKGASILMMILLPLMLISLSVAAPILARPFYYAQIDALALPERTGWSEQTIREAYDEMLDFCLVGGAFGTGQLRWSESGRSHFVDVQKLFRLDLIVLVITGVSAGILQIARLRRNFLFYCFLGRGPAFWAGAGTALCFALVGALAALDFDRAFTVFHAIFFPGKDNWIFDPSFDEIILILPQEFFRNCAILMVAVLLCACTAMIIGDLIHASRVVPAEQMEKSKKRVATKML